MRQRADAVIIGGGPAGALAATLLARLGLEVVLVERGPRHRPKTCGHCVAPRALARLREVGLIERIGQLSVGRTSVMTVHAIGGGRMRAPLARDESEAGLIVPRERLDQALMDAVCDAGADLLQPAAARIVALRRDGATVRIAMDGRRVDLECRLVIGADGAGSRVARCAGLADASSAGRKYGVSFSMPFDGLEGMSIEAGAIEMFLAPGGYVGMVRQDDGSLHAAALIDATAGFHDADPCSFLLRTMQMHSAWRRDAREMIARVPMQTIMGTGPLAWRPASVASSTVALVGDAAGYIEPFTGEGITWALESAIALARAIERSRDAREAVWSERAAARYANAWRDGVQKRQRLCRGLAAMLQRPRLAGWIVRLGEAAPRLATRIARQVVHA